jgi:Ca2+-binding EF-hand superfamily protein
MNLRWKLAVGSLLVALPLAAQVFAQDEDFDETDPQKLFEQLDKNKDGQLIPSEATGKNRPTVNRLVRNGDKNNDRGLSLEEFTAALEEDKKKRAEEAANQPPDIGPGNIDPTAMMTPQMVFARLDRDRDGSITMNELNPADRQVFGAVFERLDRNRDRSIDGQEFTSGWQLIRGRISGVATQMQNNMRAASQTNPLFAALDLDGDGSLSAAEIDAAPVTLRKLDANGDGAVSQAELGPAAGPAVAASDRRATAAATASERLVKRYLQADKDGDGKLSEDEAPSALKRQFEQIDKNGDGFLDTDELKAPRGREEGRSRRAGRRGRDTAEEAAPEEE